ncbi:MAG: alpha/beta fold hydrolase [Gammaproteobacteria bacterium]|nr:alpha/beta fold hydrolase [Gammaproteobacteria bacterium]
MIVKILLGILAAWILGLILAITLGGPKPPPPIASINNPFKALNMSDLPPIQMYLGKDQTKLGYRYYPASASKSMGSVILVHGSSANSVSMHPLAKACAQAGYATYSLDIRGHGASGHKGTIDYIGQLEDDMLAFTQQVRPSQPSTLLGFSAGGGFALRMASGEHSQLFQSYVFLAPFVHHSAPNQRPDSGGWANVGIPRTLALSLLNEMGITRFNSLPVLSFALDPAAKNFLTPEYSYALASNFRPLLSQDYRITIEHLKAPYAVIAGAHDEAFFTDKLLEIFPQVEGVSPVTVLPQMGHIDMILKDLALSQITRSIELLQSKH